VVLEIVLTKIACFLSYEISRRILNWKGGLFGKIKATVRDELNMINVDYLYV
jgi:hypothetical protein